MTPVRVLVVDDSVVIRRLVSEALGKDPRVEVVGTTSSAGTEQGRAALSTARAQAVRTLLAEALGVPEDSIGAVGLGYDTEKGGCVVDRADGVLDPMLAAANRKVTIRIVPAA